MDRRSPDCSHASLAVLGVEGVGVLDEEAETDRPHLVRILKLHVEVDGVTAVANVVRVLRVGFNALGAESELNPDLLCVKYNGAGLARFDATRDAAQDLEAGEEQDLTPLTPPRLRPID